MSENKVAPSQQDNGNEMTKTGYAENVHIIMQKPERLGSAMFANSGTWKNTFHQNTGNDSAAFTEFA